MLYLSQERAQSSFEGMHPITGQHVKCKWADFSQTELAAIFNADPSNVLLFDGGTPEIEAVKEQPKNVNTTAPSTTTGRTIHTTAAKAEGTSQE